MFEIEIETMIQETVSKGGSTISLTKASVPTNGYMVGGIVDSLIFDANLVLDVAHRYVAARSIEQWLKSQKLELITDAETFLGMWIDSETGHAYVDFSLWYSEEGEAIRDAKLFEEIAIWDLANGEEIRVQ